MPTEGVSGVYEIECLANGKLYVGSSVDVANRWRVHRYELRRGRHHCRHLQNCWDKYGPEAFRVTVLERCPPVRSALLACEQRWLDRLNPALNHCLLAGSRLGVPFTPAQRAGLSAVRKGRGHSPETRAKMSAAAMGNKNGLGVACSPEKRAALRAAHLGRPNPSLRGKPLRPEVIEKISAAQAGKRRPWQAGVARSAVTRARISAAQKGRSHRGSGWQHTPETVEKIASAHRGAKRSPEARARMSAAQMGNRNARRKRHA